MDPLIFSNGFLKVMIVAGGLTVSPIDPASGPQSIRIELPGTPHGEVQSADSNDSSRGSGKRLTFKHGDRTTTATIHDNDPFLYLETRVENPGPQPISLEQTTVARLTFEGGKNSGASSWNTLGSGGMRPASDPRSSFAYFAVADPQSRNGAVCAWFTQLRGVGTLMASNKNGQLSLNADLEFGNLLVRPGQSRDTDTLIVGFFPDVRLGLERYAEEIAKNLGIRLKPKPNVFCTWYARRHPKNGASTDKELFANATFAKEHLQPFGLNVFQIDDHWQAGKHPDEARRGKGPIKTFKESNSNYPDGMQVAATNLRDLGFAPGLWYIPFGGESAGPAEIFPPGIFAKDPETGNPLANSKWSGATIDSTSSEGLEFLRERVRRIQNWGYTYIKIDGLHVGVPSENIYIHRTPGAKTLRHAVLHDPDATHIEGYRRGLAMLRSETPDTFVLGCTTTQNMVSFAPVFGMVDAMRVGPDNDQAARGGWEQVVRGADYAGNLWFLNGRVWHNDPDPIYVRESNPLDKARWMASWLAVSGAMNTSSERYAELPPERLDLLRRTLPSHNLPSRPVDILERKNPAIWITGNNRQHIVGLFNWHEKNPTSLECDPARMGLDPAKSYEAFDFWANRYLGTFTGRWKESLEGAGCRVLSLRESTPHPQLLSTSRHITQGLIDVTQEDWNAENLVLRGTSAMVAGDPYELRIVCPDGFAPLKFSTNATDASASPITREGKLLRVTVTPGKTGPVEWELSFSNRSSTESF